MRYLTWLGVVSSLLLGGADGCTQSSSVTCPDGRVCPSGTACVTAAGAGDTSFNFCVDPNLVTPCDGKPDLADCSPDPQHPSTCHGGACFADACGNGLLDPGTAAAPNEVCDDGNQASLDGCSQDCKSNEKCGNGTIDVADGEECDDTNLLSHDGCSGACKVEAPSWEVLRQPYATYNPTIAFSPDEQRIVAFGGYFNSTVVSDTIEWSGHDVSLLSSPILPPASDGGAMAYGGDHSLVMYGSRLSNTGETYALGADGWHLLDPATRPPGRFDHAMIYDSRRKRAVMFGGHTTDANDVWVFHAGNWSKLVVSGTPPSARYNSGLVYDPTRDVMIVFGGATASPFANVNEIWELAFDATGGTWTNKTPASNPLATGTMTAAFEPTLGRALVLCNLAAATPSAYSWNGTSLSPAPTLPSGLTDWHLVTDTVRSRLVGLAMDSTVTPNARVIAELDAMNGTWATAYRFAASPALRHDAYSVTDPHRHQILRVGGIAMNGTTGLAETWIWNGAWRQAPSPFTGRWGHTMAYDEAHDEIVMFGGTTTGSFNGCTNETWLWRHSSPTDLGHWQQVFPSKSPSARCVAQMTWDGTSGKVLLHGGAFGVSGVPPYTTFNNETWQWDGTTWSQPTSTTMAGAINPPIVTDRLGQRPFHYDPRTNEVVLYHPGTGAIWTWDGSWHQEMPQHAPAAYGEQSVWDATRGELVMYVDGVFWHWNGAAGSRDWQEYEVPSPPIWDTSQWDPNYDYPIELTEDPDGDGIVILGPPVDSRYAGELVRLRYRTPLHDPHEVCTNVDTDGDGVAGCADPDCWAVCSPLCPPGANTASCPMSPRCGDGVCDSYLETCELCPGDCACPTHCGNNVCDSGETTASCPGDCP